jgi:hypothetical protein
MSAISASFMAVARARTATRDGEEYTHAGPNAKPASAPQEVRARFSNGLIVDRTRPH